MHSLLLCHCCFRRAAACWLGFEHRRAAYHVGHQPPPPPCTTLACLTTATDHTPLLHPHPHLHRRLARARVSIGGSRTPIMTSTVGQRALSTLAKKLHPQLPLTPRESQQLLSLLTASFRTHLNREHPVYTADKAHTSATRTNAGRDDQRTAHAPSSAALASRHIETVLSNPLFAVKPTRRGSESAASRVLNDSLSWFLDEIASGNATLSKAALVLEILDKQPHPQISGTRKGRTVGAVIGDWLHSSGLYNSRDFLNMCLVKPTATQPITFISRLVTVLMVDGKESLLWKWYSNPFTLDSSAYQAVSFRKQLLKHMVVAEAGQDLPRGIALFSRAHKMVEEQPDKRWEELRPAGQHLVQAVMSKPTAMVDNNVYDAFRRNVRLWVPKKWAQAVNSMLCLHHPGKASARPGLKFIEDPTGAATYANAKPTQRRFIVQLSLGVARQLLEQERFDEAQTVMAFTKQHFPDLVLENLPTEQKQVAKRQASKINKARTNEETNLALLDSLAFT